MPLPMSMSMSIAIAIAIAIAMQKCLKRLYDVLCNKFSVIVSCRVNALIEIGLFNGYYVLFVIPTRV